MLRGHLRKGRTTRSHNNFGKFVNSEARPSMPGFFILAGDFRGTAVA
jgi:hypothetical protein